MTILLTGATGVIGSVLLPLLARSHDVTVLARNPLLPNALCGDVTVPGLGLCAYEHTRLTDRLRLVVHAAALTDFRRAPEEYHRVNTLGTRHVTELAEHAGAALIHLSTAALDAPVRGTGTGDRMLLAYAASKRRAESVVREAGCPAVNVRVGGVLGDSVTGRIARPQAVHRLLRGLAAGRSPALGIPDDHWIDLLPQDVLARYLADLAEQALLGREFLAEPLWATAGPARLTLGELKSLCGWDAQGVGQVSGSREGAERPPTALAQILTSVFLPPSHPQLPTSLGTLVPSGEEMRAAVRANIRRVGALRG
ncbi:SDR family oxidoreductase [Streptomyces sp. TRM66268-LWL]|uniref:SDR family oxidoreductase n=1 Tax=Streptomyces polyasparticus TaxID=2767826 RepID=A0ABR7SC08_9ACTN|nr:SDR family oxidoreductase [Streptomyces polyasparticus]MBC9712953.1 SDR family oxidoreductase [Streptomyces polyasparticus]